MKIEFFNCPKPLSLELSLLPEKPEFVTYEPDFALIEKYKKDFEHYSNVLIIAHGGSITTLLGYYSALGYAATKKVYFLSTTDPDYIFQLRQQLKKEQTLVIAISKSGETTTQIEALMQFVDYPMLIITGRSSTLRAVGEKIGATIAMHPAIGGRYTGLTEVALLPAGIIALDVKKIYEGAKHFYLQYAKENLAWKAGSVFYQLEQKGYADVFMPFYSHNLFPMSNLIVQLCHESFGKEGKGQTYFAHEAPESQHHTNQRFFGGQKNIAGFFTTIDNFLHPTLNIFPPQTHSVQLKRHSLFDISKIPLEKSMEFEAIATLEDAKINSIPTAHIALSSLTASELGSFVAFWQLFAVYSSVLRAVNPFDQPQVENSKNISFNKRLAYKGLL